MSDNWFMIPLIVILIVFSAFFSGSEIAIATSNKLRLKKSAEGGDRSAQAAEYISDNFTRSLSTILIGNNLVNIAASSAATVLCVAYFGAAGQGIATASMTVLLLIFGETVPKIVAAEYSDTLILWIARPLRFFMTLFRPVVAVASALVEKISFLWTREEAQPSVTTEELCEIVDTIEDEGVFTEKEGELIKSAIEFSDVTARDIMTPRVDVAAFDIEDGTDALLQSEELMEYSRIPVYRESLDNIVGILNRRRLLCAAVSDDSEEPDIESMLRPPLYVHMTKNISSILMELREKHSHMAIVLDEFGGMTGILTLEDILEEIVGEIYDESDEIEREVYYSGDDSLIVDGTMKLDDLFELVDYTPADFKSEYVTVNGWITELLDRFPEKGDKAEFERLTMTVLKTHQMCAERVKIELAPAGAEEDDDPILKLPGIKQQ